MPTTKAHAFPHFAGAQDLLATGRPPQTARDRKPPWGASILWRLVAATGAWGNFDVRKMGTLSSAVAEFDRAPVPESTPG
jgi:hypothetical protein